MQTLRLDPDSNGLRRAADLLAQGACVAIPTETVYGLAANARNGKAVAGIYQAKGRPDFNPLIVHVPDLNAARSLATFSDEALLLAQNFWPGPLTLVLPLRTDAGISRLVTAGLDTVGLRVPAHAVARKILSLTGLPLAAPSANISGLISPTTADHVLDPETGLGGRIAAVLDAGACPVGVESTIIGWSENKPVMLRPGGIAAEQIETLLGQSLARAQDNPATPNAPGQLSSHYAPRAPLRLNADPRPGETHLAFGRPGPLTLSATGDLTEAAARLFDLLRRADAYGLPISVAPIPDHGLGAAINDRLRRAAAPR
ncbi:MAG: L-threonylcarbamoyladenylate synthase [Paracoccus sp. (in: a-proteobacteria)]|nr:L-threonylcarbamoyladenylate synthase [Paracoccus sp. (in: a-proteobacteria)]